MSKKKKEFGRRQFLKVLGITGATAPLTMDPSFTLLKGLVDGVISNAVAQESGQNTKNYIFLAQSGGPARWMFDLPVKLYADEKFEHEDVENHKIFSHPMVKTAKLADGSFEYRTIAYGRDPINGKDYLLPAIWGMNIPQSNGSGGIEWVPMTTLADQWLCLRGIDMQQDGHFNNLVKQLRPDAGAASISGMNADKSNRYLAAVHLADDYKSTFKSQEGKNHYLFPKGEIGYEWGEAGSSAEKNPLQLLLSPFAAKTSLTENKELTDGTLKHVMQVLGRYTKERLPGSEYLYKNYSEAEAMIKRGVSLVGSEHWQTGKERYDKIFRSLFTDNAPKGEGEKESEWKKLGLENDAPSTFEEVISASGGYTRYYKRFVANSVLTEFLINEKLSSSITFEVPNTTLANNDAHGTLTQPAETRNLMAHVLGKTMNFLMASAAINELSRGIGTENWKNTVVQLGGEFGRSPRNDMEGSEHGVRANSTSIFSGSLKGPVVVGNVIKGAVMGDLARTDHHGSWGECAIVKNPRGEKIKPSMGNQASTICHILGVETPTPNFSSLVRLDGNGVPISTIGAPKTVQVKNSDDEEPEVAEEGIA